ncbi:hypothetical protein SAV31267_027650 [Streptomyces avermitilis]|uniref:Uncharacterized protein n=1 Tax=Streptomyces avermitilis TaxID=33903 RepID=A0A4D4MML4_STRAX|nr:hypothetical protein SAV31267_027650 [Streptomyces avermitilis]
MLLLGSLWRGMRLPRRTPLVAYGYAHELVTVVQLAHDVFARGVDDRVGDQLGDDQGGRVTGVLADLPAGQPSTRQTPGLGHGSRVCGQLEAEPALGGRVGAHPSGVAETGSVFGGVCS